jgi:hypothetical protein
LADVGRVGLSVFQWQTWDGHDCPSSTSTPHTPIGKVRL